MFSKACRRIQMIGQLTGQGLIAGFILGTGAAHMILWAFNYSDDDRTEKLILITTIGGSTLVGGIIGFGCGLIEPLPVDRNTAKQKASASESKKPAQEKKFPQQKEKELPHTSASGMFGTHYEQKHEILDVNSQRIIDSLILDGKDLYLRLGIERNANRDGIRKAFLTKARQHHPDKHNTSKENAEIAKTNFIKIKEAYEILSDAAARDYYDRKSSRLKYTL